MLWHDTTDASVWFSYVMIKVRLDSGAHDHLTDNAIYLSRDFWIGNG
jgi:hypothetical protein